MKKAISIIFVSIFILLCIAPIVGLISGYQNNNAEKRAVSELPSIIIDGKINMNFTKEFDDYFTQNFAFRADFITMYAKINNALFKKSVSSKVIIGKDGWLFFEPTLNDYQRINLLTENQIYRVCKTLEIQKMYLDQSGIDFIFAIAPNKSSIYNQYMPNRYLVSDEKNNVEMLFEELFKNQFDYVDLYKALNNRDDIVYHKLDTHWNNKGALISYNELLNAIQNVNDDFIYSTYNNLVPEITKSWNRDLSDMLYPTANMRDEQYIYDIQKQYSTRRAIKSYEDMLIETTCETGILNLTMFRDSFANALIPIMSNEFSHITYSRATPYEYRNINSENTDVVLLEIVERNLPDIIKQAPLLFAPEIDLDSNAELDNIETHFEIIEQDKYLRITGVAIPEKYESNKNYDIYVRLSSTSGSKTYIPFPILEQGYLEEFQQYGNTAFSTMIDLDTFYDEEFQIEIIVFAG